MRRYDPYANTRRSWYKLVQGIWLLFGIVEGLLTIRFILKLLGANEAAGFGGNSYAESVRKNILRGATYLTLGYGPFIGLSERALLARAREP